MAERDEEYARQANAAPWMTDAQAAELATVAQSGGFAARQALMLSHRRLVVKLVNRYAPTDLPSNQRIRLGENGLVLAVERFDPAKGFRFSTYATWRIRQALTTGPGGDDAGRGVREPRAPQPCSDSGSIAL